MKTEMDLNIPIDELTAAITLKVTIIGYSGWIVRLKIARWLLRLACRVAGMGLEIVEA